MTEDEWLTSENLQRMIELLRGKGTERKRRLLAAACYRSAKHRNRHEQFLNAADMAEAFADRQVSQKEMESAIPPWSPAWSMTWQLAWYAVEAAIRNVF